jgi:hypothetical protein
MAELQKGSPKLGSPEEARLPDHAFKPGGVNFSTDGYQMYSPDE